MDELPTPPEAVQEAWATEQEQLRRQLDVQTPESLPLTTEWASEADAEMMALLDRASDVGAEVDPDAGETLAGRVLAFGHCEGVSVSGVRFLGGVDISFVKDDPSAAIAALVVVAFPSLEVVYSVMEEVTLDQPYIPGFLAFREVDFFVQLHARLMEDAPEFAPQVILVDGNGVLHRRSFGLASHLGVLLGVPTIGIGKTFYNIDGLDKAKVIADVRSLLDARGQGLPLVGDSGRVWGIALRSGSGGKPIFVSCGHHVSLAAATALVVAASQYRIPEPVRQADLLSRDVVRDAS